MTEQYPAATFKRLGLPRRIDRASQQVEPAAAETVAKNLNPVALSRPGGNALGAHAGEQAIRRVCTDAGFGR